MSGLSKLYTFQFIYAQRSKKCMMVCNSKLCKNSMYYAPLYAALINILLVKIDETYSRRNKSFGNTF